MQPKLKIQRFKQIYSNKCLHQEQERSETNNSTVHLKELEKEEKTKTDISRKKEVNRAQINRD